jgi:hypothetical protein
MNFCVRVIVYLKNLELFWEEILLNYSILFILDFAMTRHLLDIQWNMIWRHTEYIFSQLAFVKLLLLQQA